MHICRGSNGPLEIWYKANSTAGSTSFGFTTGSSGANIEAQVSEWHNVATSSPLDQTGTNYNASSAGTLTVTTSGAITSSNELAVTGFLTSSGLSTFTAGTGWTATSANPGGGFDTSYQINPTSGSTLTQSATSNPQTSWAAGIATFLP